MPRKLCLLSLGRLWLLFQTGLYPFQVSQEPVRQEGELWRIRAQAGLSAAAIVAVDIFFHFFYILTIPSDLKFASRLPDSALGGSPQWGGGRATTGNSLMCVAPTL